MFNKKCFTMFHVFGLAALLFVWMNACSSTEEKQDGDVQNSGDENAAKAPKDGSKDGAKKASDGEDVNNASDSEFDSGGTNKDMSLNQQQQGGDQLNLGQDSKNNASGSPVPDELTAPNSATTPASTETPAANAASGAGAAAATAAPATGGSVKYVVDSAPIYNQPAAGSSVGSLERGDHPLVFSGGEYLQMSDGRYVPAKSLTDQGVGRTRKANGWRGGAN